MIIPTPEFDPFFAESPGQSFQDRMIDYIRREFADTLAENPQARCELIELGSEEPGSTETALSGTTRHSEAA